MTGFGGLLHAEWTKFRTVRGWVVGMVVAAGLIMALGLLPGEQGSCGKAGTPLECVLPVGPDGLEVTDTFTFVHQPLAGDGAITVRVSSLTATTPSGPGVVPWAKAGLIIKDGTRQGSTYAAVMVTGGHGVRMQDDYTHDRAGRPGAVGAGAPRWLRLTRTGHIVTGQESTDGAGWTTVGTVSLPTLPSTAEVGLFTTSPQWAEAVGSLGVSSVMGGPTQAVGVFDHVDRRGAPSGGAWHGDTVGTPAGAQGPLVGVPDAAKARAPDQPPNGYERAGDTFTLTGSGDIAPAVSGANGLGTTITRTLVGTFLGLVVVVVVGTMFVTAEYRRGMIRTTLAASPGRGRVLVAKALVVGAVTYAVGLVAAAVVVVFGQRVLRGNGVYVHPVTFGTEVRVVAGTAALLAVSAVLAVAMGAILRRSAAAVTTAIVAIVLPYLLAQTVLPAGAAAWLLRVSPAAAFAIQQSTTRYAQVANLYTPADGYFPLGPWTGFAVLVGWAVLALGLAAYLLRRRDA